MIFLPGWNPKIDEVSNGVFKVTLTDRHGRIAEIIDNAPDETIDRAFSYAFEIESQVSKNWNKFLYELFLANLDSKAILDTEFDDEAFGSWFIQIGDRRIVLDGKDFALNLEDSKNNAWETNAHLDRNDINFHSFKNLLTQVTK